MANTTLINNLVAKEALRLLKNNTILATKVFRGYEPEFEQKVNGYLPGATISIRRPSQAVLRIGNVMNTQDAVEGSTSITVDQQIGADFNFTGIELVQNMELTDVAVRVLKDGMIKIADKIDSDLFGLFTQVNNWVGTPGAVMSTYDSFAAGTERLINGAVPMDDLTACLSPRDKRGMAASVANPAGIFADKIVEGIYRRGKLGEVDGVETYVAQNVQNLTTGTRTNGTNNSGVPTTYAASKDIGTQTLSITGLGANATISAGEVFTLAGVFDVNPVSKATQTYLKQFTVTTATTASAGGVATVTIRPAMILTPPYQNISAAPAAAAVLTWAGAASALFRQNMIFHKNAFALAIVPMINPPGAVDVARMSLDGISVRSAPVWDGTNDNSKWRLDVLYGIKCIDERLAVRLSGT